MIQLRKLALDVLYALKTAGADGGECTVTTESTDETNSLGKAEYLLREFSNTEIELRAVKGGKVADMRINQTDIQNIVTAAVHCVAMAECGRPIEKTALGYKGRIEPDRLLPMQRDPEKLYRRFEELMNTLRDEYPMIASDAMAWYIDRKMLYLNTDGQEVSQHTQSCGCGWQGGATDGTTTTDCEFFHVDCENLDTPFIDQGMVRAKLENVQRMLNPRRIEGGKFVGTVIVNPDQAAYYAYQIMERVRNMAEDDGLPPPACSPCVSIFQANSDEPYVPGMLPQNSPAAEVEYIIRNGEVVPDPTKGMSAAEKADYDAARQRRLKWLNHQAFGIEAGETPYAELIRSVKRGLLLGHVQGTMPSPDGEFSGAAKNSFYIENGEIKYPVIETMLSGNVFDMFKHVEGISKETVRERSNLTPWIAFGGVTIL